MSEEMTMQGMGVVPAPGWVHGFIQAVAGQALAPRDGRVKSLWMLLKQQQLLAQSPWLRALLIRIWKYGLPARPRPRTTQRLMQQLQQWGVLPGPVVTPGFAPVQAPYPVGFRPLRPAGYRPSSPPGGRPWRPAGVRPWRPGVRPVQPLVRPMQPVQVRPLRPVQVRPMGPVRVHRRVARR
jgi:hypothetical protein